MDWVSAFLRVTQSFDFCMRQPGTMMPAAANDFAALHEHRPHERVRRRSPITFACDLQSQSQVANVHWMFSRAQKFQRMVVPPPVLM